MGAAEGGFVKDSAKPEQHAWWDKWDLDSSATKRKRRRDEDIVPQVPPYGNTKNLYCMVAGRHCVILVFQSAASLLPDEIPQGHEVDYLRSWRCK